jgi:excisionase family DNA binding protein
VLLSTGGCPAALRVRVPARRRGSESEVVTVSFVETGRVGSSRLQLTIAEVCDELHVARSTFYDWRAKGKAPRCIKLPNGEMRVRRDELDRWIASCEEVA